MTDLRELCLAGNQILSVAPLEHLTKLELLDLSGNYMAYMDLTPLTRLPELKILNLAYTQVNDLRPLRSCPSLKTLYLSHDSALYLEDASLPGVEIIYVDTLVTDYWELKEACADDSVTRIFSMSNITIPEGETLTIPAGTTVHHGQAEFVNYGTLQVNGTLYAYEDYYMSHGALRIGDGGLFHCYPGLKQATQNGSVTVEEGGNLIVDWGMLNFGETTLENEGYVKANGMGVIDLKFVDVLNNGTIEASDGSDATAALMTGGFIEIVGNGTDTANLNEVFKDSLADSEIYLAKGTIYGDPESFRGDGTVIGEITTMEDLAGQRSLGNMLWMQEAFENKFSEEKDVHYITADDVQSIMDDMLGIMIP